MEVVRHYYILQYLYVSMMRNNILQFIDKKRAYWRIYHHLIFYLPQKMLMSLSTDGNEVSSVIVF